MENASKALIMAGEVLISVIIVSMLMLVFNSLSSYQQTKEQNDRDAEVLAFNTKYEDYNRNDVRGNELYSLINIVIDYNTRKSTAGNEDEGQDYNYKPIEITIDLSSQSGGTKIENPEGQKKVFTSNNYTINTTTNVLYEIFQKMKGFEEKYGESNIYSLASKYTRYKDILKNEDVDYNDREKLIERLKELNNLCEQRLENIPKIPSSEDNDFEKKAKKVVEKYKEVDEEVCEYYEYIVFTRAHFDCTSVKYDEGNGRIIEMEFKYNGKIN